MADTTAVTYTFTNGTAADADQVDQNFADLVGYLNGRLGNLTTGQFLIADSSGRATGHTLSGDITSTNAGVTSIGTGKVTTAKVLDSAITTAKINAAAITLGLMANNSVGTAQLVADSVTAAKIATGAVTTSEILDGTIATGDIADNAVTVAKMALAAPNDVYATTTSVTAAGHTEQIGQVTVTNGVYLVFAMAHIEANTDSTNVHTIYTFNGSDHESDDILIKTTSDMVINETFPVTITSTTTFTFKIRSIGTGNYTIRGASSDYPGSRLTLVRIS